MKEFAVLRLISRTGRYTINSAEWAIRSSRQYTSRGTTFATRTRLLLSSSSSLPSRSSSLRVEEIDPHVRYCRYHLGERESQMPQAAGLDQLQAKLEVTAFSYLDAMRPVVLLLSPLCTAVRAMARGSLHARAEAARVLLAPPRLRRWPQIR